ncbi:DUF6438 domain-containing protein [uncultured Massilia sp.]|uniref:DUF6438 domain-containing protein n=1 Tax=uncultured Massilia sp. TaxID=169973 RepID=UPI002585EC29|nr:DUF6438 domain-containing protein [uncultured Massilia sp.]
MRIQATWFAAAAALLLSGCSDGVPPWRQAHWPTGGFEVVYLARSACYGTCPVYEIDVFADGRVRYTGEEHVKTTGTHEARLSPHAVTQLAAAIQAARFETLGGSYQDGNDGCRDLFTDAPSLTIGVKRTGRLLRVNYYTGCSGPAVPSARIHALADTIDRIAGTQAFIVGQAQPIAGAR